MSPASADAGTQGVVDVVVDVRDPVDEAHDFPLERGRLARASVVQDPVPGLHGQVEAAAVALQHLHDAEGLLVMSKPAAETLVERLVERLFTGVPERRMAKVVPERDRLGEILVQLERPRHRPRDAGGLERVHEACAVVVALRVDEDLGLVLQAPEGLAVDDPVAVALKRRSQPAFLLFGIRPSARLVGTHRER